MALLDFGRRAGDYCFTLKYSSYNEAALLAFGFNLIWSHGMAVDVDFFSPCYPIINRHLPKVLHALFEGKS